MIILSRWLTEGVHKVELFRETIRIIREECDIVINTTTGVGPGVLLEERIAIIRELSADPKMKPDMASLKCGSLNFGMLNRIELGMKTGEGFYTYPDPEYSKPDFLEG